MLSKFLPLDNLQKLGAPKYIRGNPFQTKDRLHRFEIKDTPITRDRQVEWLNSMLTEDGGWVAFICGSSEDCRLMAYSLFNVYYEMSHNLIWHRPSSSSYDLLLDERKTLNPHMIVLDSLLTHPKMHPNASRGYDPTRIGKIYDIVGKYRGFSSLVVLCPDLTPEEAHSISTVQPEFLFNLKQGGRERDL